jgi:orotidine-5'-phosphate decarboxylase
LEERFDIHALEKTTREIIADLKNADINDDDKLYLKKILSQADMVKFAKFSPEDEDGYSSLRQSIEFVERTKKAENEQEEISE